MSPITTLLASSTQQLYYEMKQAVGIFLTCLLAVCNAYVLPRPSREIRGLAVQSRGGGQSQLVTLAAQEQEITDLSLEEMFEVWGSSAVLQLYAW